VKIAVIGGERNRFEGVWRRLYGYCFLTAKAPISCDKASRRGKYMGSSQKTQKTGLQLIDCSSAGRRLPADLYIYTNGQNLDH
jgi:hypothetical protein